MSTSEIKMGSPLAPDEAAERPDVVLKKRVLKLGMDGSSLPRLMVVTANNVYICLPSGGITRTIAISRIERVTLCPREGMINDEHGHEAPSIIDNATQDAGPSAATATAAGGKGDTSRSSPTNERTRKSKGSTTFFASLFSRGGAEKARSSSQRSRGYKEDVDETHPASPTRKGSVPQHRSSTTNSSAILGDHESSSSTTTASSMEWAVIVTLGIAFEAPLAVQLLHMEDGADFVAALRASPHISDRAVFNMPNEAGPTNPAGEPIFSAPPRRADPLVPRVLERSADEEVEREKIVEEVELSPSSPRSTTVASPPPQPEPEHGATQRPLEEAVEEKASARREEAKATTQREQGLERASALKDGHTLRSKESAPPQSQTHEPPSTSSTPPSSRASSVQTAEPERTDAVQAEDVPREQSAPVVVLTPFHESMSVPQNAAEQPPPPPQQDLQKQQQLTNPIEHAPTNGGTSLTFVSAESEGRTPSPLRAAPQREAPQPPLQSLISTFVAPSRVLSTSGPSDLPDSSANIRRVLQMDDAASAPVAPANEEKTTPTMWEAIRDSEARSLSQFSNAEQRGSGSSNNSSSERRRFTGVAAPTASRSPTHTPHLSSVPHLNDDGSAVPESYRPDQPLAKLNSTQQVSAISTSTARPPPAAASAPAPAAVRTPVYVESLQAELAQQSETVTRLRRSLQAQEALLLELAEVKNEVRGLRAALAERDEQCAEWQAAYTHAEEHIGGLRREQEHLLATQEERLRRAHREELEAVQSAFEEYDTRMTGFVDQLQRDHREEAAQWQHERRTLHHQLEELHRQQEEEERARAVAEATAWHGQQRQTRSPPSPTVASYLDSGREYPYGAPPQHMGDQRVYENERGRVQEKGDEYVAQHQDRKRTTPHPHPPSSHSLSPSSRATRSAVNAPRGSVRSPPVQTSKTASVHPTPASPWPQPRSAEAAPAPAPPPSSPPSRMAFEAHHLFDHATDDDGSFRESGRHLGSAESTAGHRPRRDPRGDSLIQTPPSTSLEKPSERAQAKRGVSGYIPHRRTYV